VRIPGEFSVYNSMGAVVAAVSIGIAQNAALAALSKAAGVKGRAEVVPTAGKDYTVIIDYAHSPDGLVNIISGMRKVAGGRIITLFGCGGDRDATKRPLMGKAAGQLSDFCVITSDNPRSEEPLKIIKQIEEGIEPIGKPYKIIENRAEAIKWVLDNGQKGDTIILAGKGHENYQILSTGKIHFDEREVVAQHLNSVR
jgi:UDP-N-acetylmuramoyl-L-alanyl-D-glutamate--2,6-diaminopimelate ligase